MEDLTWEGFKRWVWEKQEELCRVLEEIEGSPFEKRDWKRSDELRGEGRVRLLRGTVVEKAGVNVSAVEGSSNPLTGRPYRATGLSVIVHPLSPHAPSAHLNLRYFEEREGSWMGGGMDLTPMGVRYEEDIRLFREAGRRAAQEAGYDPDRLERWADEYFFLPHRKRTRGAGGIFFDHLPVDSSSLHLARGTVEGFLRAYSSILQRRGRTPFSPQERASQLRERGIYVEFNLLYDRGTRFGLQSGGDPEAIFVSLPPMASW